MKKAIAFSTVFFCILFLLMGEGMAAMPKVHLIQSVDAISMAPVYIARANKFFEAEGIDVEVIMAKSGDIAIQSQLAGDVEFGAQTMSHVMKVYDAGKLILSVGNIMNRMTMGTVINKESLASKGVKPEDLGKMKLEDKIKLLKGMKLGITGPGAMTDLVYRYYLKRVGINAEKEVEIVPVGGMGNMLAALQKRSIDSFMLSPPTPYEAVQRGFAVVLIDPATGEIPEFSNFVFETLTVLPNYADKNPDVVKKVSSAIAKANNYVIGHSDETVKILQTFWPAINPEVIKHSTDVVKATLTKNALMDKAGIESHAKFLFESGFIKKMPPLDEGTFWTNKYLPK